MGLSNLLTVLALSCFISSVFTAELNHVTHLNPIFPEAPKTPIKLPALPPLKSPIKLPTIPPVKAPIKVPTIPPIKPPVVLPPVTPQVSKAIAVLRGFVYCQRCNYGGAMPIQDAVVIIACSELKKAVAQVKTGKNGAFTFFIPKKTLAAWTEQACKVILVNSPDAKCSKVPKFDVGKIGSGLKPGKSTVVIKKITYEMFKAASFFLKPPGCPN